MPETLPASGRQLGKSLVSVQSKEYVVPGCDTLPKVQSMLQLKGKMMDICEWE